MRDIKRDNVVRDMDFFRFLSHRARQADAALELKGRPLEAL